MTVRVLVRGPAPLVALCGWCGSLVAFDADDVRTDHCNVPHYTMRTIPCPVCAERDAEARAMVDIEYHSDVRGYGPEDSRKNYLGELPEE